MTNERIQYLFTQYYNGQATTAESQELGELLQADQHRETAVQHLLQLAATAPSSQYVPDAQLEKTLSTILPAPRKVHPLRRYWPQVAAAAILAAAIAGAALYIARPFRPSAMPEAVVIGPGGNGAMLTLSNGQHILLDSTGTPVIAHATLTNGQLTYDGRATDTSTNLLETPRGRQFALVLPDGSKVWLNAASSIRFPASFGKTREVSVTGEAYFEVAKMEDNHGQRVPFRVQVNQQASVEVLGTHFNVNAYTDENSIRTTLLEGVVKMSDGAHAAVLAPGQEGRLQGHQLQVQPADMDQAVAWKNGSFLFNGRTHLTEVMRQLSRWYDVEVVYEGKVPDLAFTGEMQRNLSLQQVLHGFDAMGVHFKIEGRKIIVQP